MDFAPIILEGFEGREDSLKQIKRYVHFITPVMFYRTNDFIHSRRVLWHLEEAVSNIQEIYGNSFNVEFARTLSLVHDDVEILTGDVQLYDKENMKVTELAKLSQKEMSVIQELIIRYNKIANGYDYEELLIVAKSKKRLEAQFVSFFDKFDGGGEAWHEVWAGNSYFLLPAGGHHGKQGGYVKRLNEFKRKYPSMSDFFKLFPEYLPKPFNFQSISKRGKPHTKDSLQKDSGYFSYEKWKRTIMNREGLDNLIIQKEF